MAVIRCCATFLTMITQVKILDTEWFRVDCDNCNETLFNEETEQCLMPDTLSVNNLANDEGWLIKKNGHSKMVQKYIHICPDCQENIKDLENEDYLNGMP